MAKSLRSKREKRLKAIRREIVAPYYDKKEAAKLAAQEAALAALKLPVSLPSKAAMDVSTSTITNDNNTVDLDMADGSQIMASLKPVGKIGKKRDLKCLKASVAVRVLRKRSVESVTYDSNRWWSPMG